MSDETTREAFMEQDRKLAAQALKAGFPSFPEYTVNSPGNPLHGRTLRHGKVTEVTVDGRPVKVAQFGPVEFTDAEGNLKRDVISVRLDNKPDLAREVEQYEAEMAAWESRKAGRPMTYDEEEEAVHGFS